MGWFRGEPRKIWRHGIDFDRDGAERTLRVSYFSDQVKGFEDWSGSIQGGIGNMHYGRIHLRAGFKWDGASFLTKDRFLDGAEGDDQGSDTLEPPLEHDFLYALTRSKLGPLTDENRKEYKRRQMAADRRFLFKMKREGMPFWRRRLWYRGVRVGGFAAITGTAKTTADHFKFWKWF